ncbi:MAG: MFS transporter [Alphaproteobacteria bacterium]
MTTAAIPIGDARRDAKVMGLVSVAHFASHYYQLVLPPLFPILKEEWGVSYTALGLAVTVFYLASGLGQFIAGFVVDRIGARPVLLAGVVLIAGASGAIGLTGSYEALLPLAALAGLGNAVFHPADYSILSASVQERRLGRAYGFHTLGGTLGYAAAPATILPLALAIGWRGALMVAALIGLAIAVLLVVNGDLLRDGRTPAATERRPSAAAAILQAPVVLCFVYFVFFAAGLTVVQAFFPTAVGSLFGTPPAVAAAALTGYFLGNACGILAGGVIADRWPRPDAIVVAGLIGSGIFLAIAGLFPLAAVALTAAVAGAGACSGATSASRDMLVRSTAPAGARGRVFGFVYSALDVGGAIAPVAAGFLLDRGRADFVFALMAGCYLAAAVTVPFVRRLSRI